MSDGSEPAFDHGTGLLTAIKFHVEIVKQMGQPDKTASPKTYNGIRMVDERGNEKDMETDNRRFREYEEYVNRGGTLSEYDLTRTDLMEGDVFKRQTDLKLKNQAMN